MSVLSSADRALVLVALFSHTNKCNQLADRELAARSSDQSYEQNAHHTLTARTYRETAEAMERLRLRLANEAIEAAGDLTPYAAHYSVIVPWSDTPTEWHPTERTGPFATLVRGAWTTPEAAHAWAAKYLKGQPYSVRFTPASDPASDSDE